MNAETLLDRLSPGKHRFYVKVGTSPRQPDLSSRFLRQYKDLSSHCLDLTLTITTMVRGNPSDRRRILSMKRIEAVYISVGFSILLTLSILLALGSKISNTLFPSAQSLHYGLRADGDPVPPFPPIPPSRNLAGTVVVIADGDPVPPFPPQLPSPNLADRVVVIADGDPVPPFPHPPLGSNLGVGELSHHASGESQLSSV